MPGTRDFQVKFFMDLLCVECLPKRQRFLPLPNATLGTRRGAGAMRAGGIAKQHRCCFERGGKCRQRRRRVRQRRRWRGTDGSAATAAGKTGPETIVTAGGRRGMACAKGRAEGRAKGRTKNRTKYRTDRQRGKLA